MQAQHHQSSGAAARTARMALLAAALCAAASMPAWAVTASPALPTGATVTYGTATITQSANTLTINQSSTQAIASFTSFSIGANASVIIHQPSASSSFLARVSGSDPSVIYGLLQSNGTVALINQNGILIGPGGVVDVARFIGSTLAISDSDFLAGRLVFSSQGTVGNVDNQGTIQSAGGGSVYLIGANVDNSGVIRSPNGEILLAAGQSVQLLDTGTPGVSVNITGVAGKVTNLGSITAAAGSIGIAAGLISNSGSISASSAVSDGGRIFLRAAQDLTTTASSSISADGADQGGNVVLYAAGAADIDGTVSVQGAAGQGGYLETSGKQSLNVVNLPGIGSGGTWYIDPDSLTVTAGSDSGVGIDGSTIYSNGGDATISNATIDSMLNSGSNVMILTSGTDGSLTVNAAIAKTAGSAATLTLNSNSSIAINADISSSAGALSLELNSNYQGSNTGSYTAQVNAVAISLNGGVLTVSDGNNATGTGALNLNNGATLALGTGGSIVSGAVVSAPVAVTDTPAAAAVLDSTVIAQAVTPANSTITNSVNSTVLTRVTDAPSTTTELMTTGGAPGTFGGPDVPKSSAGTGSQPAAAKMYCN